MINGPCVLCTRDLSRSYPRTYDTRNNEKAGYCRTIIQWTHHRFLSPSNFFSSGDNLFLLPSLVFTSIDRPTLTHRGGPTFLLKTYFSTRHQRPFRMYIYVLFNNFQMSTSAVYLENPFSIHRCLHFELFELLRVTKL